MDSVDSGQYLTFRLSGQECAIQASCVRAILPWSEFTGGDAAEGAAFITGFESLRGVIFPIVDLGRKLGFARASQGRTPRIIVVETGGGRTAGFVADVVSEVIDVRARDFRRGRIHAGGRPRRVIDADTLLTTQAAPV